MTDRCEPPPELRGVDGWHWVETHHHGQQPWFWYWLSQENRGFWRGVVQTHRCYLSPVATPAEVEALRAERDRIIAESKDCAKTLASYVRDLAVISGHTRRLGEENYTLRARVAELEGALKSAFLTWDTFYPQLPVSDEVEDAEFSPMNAARVALSPKPTE